MFRRESVKVEAPVQRAAGRDSAGVHLFEIEDHRVAAAALLDDAAALSTASRAARQQMLDRFRIEEEADAIIAVYRSLLDA